MNDSGGDYWVERAQSAEARLLTLKESIEPTLERVKQFKTNFGIRESTDGTISIDFDKFVDRLGVEQCLQLRAIIDEKYKIRGEAGEKPRIRVPISESRDTENG